MKRLTIALVAAALIFPAAAQENFWELPARMVPPSKLEELVSLVAETSPAESGDAWLFSIAFEPEQVSSIIKEDAENFSAVIVSAPEREYRRNSDAAFGAGIAAGRLLEAAASHPMLQAEMFTPHEELTPELKEELGIPHENRTVAVVLVAEKPSLPFDYGMGAGESFGFDAREFAASESDSRDGYAPFGYDDRAFAQGHDPRRTERGMEAPRGFGESGRDAPRGYDGRAFARGHDPRRSERGMEAPRGFEGRRF